MLALLDLPARTYRNRALLQAMAELGDHELKDIGLTRQDLGDAAVAPLGADPSLVLVARAEERRRRTGR